MSAMRAAVLAVTKGRISSPAARVTHTPQHAGDTMYFRAIPGLGGPYLAALTLLRAPIYLRWGQGIPGQRAGQSSCYLKGVLIPFKEDEP